MKKNISRNDRIGRALTAVFLITINLAGFVSWPERIIVWMAAGILAITSIAGSCPAYTLFGINTLTRKRTVS